MKNLKSWFKELFYKNKEFLGQPRKLTIKLGKYETSLSCVLKTSKMKNNKLFI